MPRISQEGLIFSYFERKPNRDVKHPDVVDWATAEWQRITGEVFRDPDRAIRKLHEKGLLQKIKKGVYRYDPGHAEERELEDFTLAQKAQIFKRDGYRCAVCGFGKKEGVELHIDHIHPRSKGGKSVLANGQILCGKHNFKKKNYKQTELGKMMFITLLRKSISINDTETRDFCEEVLRVYDKHGVDEHIKWRD